MAKTSIKARDVDWATVQKHYDEGFSSRSTAKSFALTKGQWDAAVERGVLKCRKLRLYKDEEVFVVGPVVSGTWLKKRLLKRGLVENECSRCRLRDWMGTPIVLQLDHVNGNRKDNRIGNLRLLCPNCHSQTETFAGRNIKKKYRPQVPPKFHLVETPTKLAL